MSVSNYLRELKRVQKRAAQLAQKRADLLQKRQQLEEDMENNEQETKENAQEEERILLQLRQDIDGRLQQRGQEEGQVRPISWLGYGRLRVYVVGVRHRISHGRS
jgi:vacuolar-type H+-ATPase subunit I/STV1